MNGTDAYEYLKNVFVSTFIDELIPGIFHNFANPLNGIMGRSNLMQRRLKDFIEKVVMRYPNLETEMDQSARKLVSDIDAIVNESDKFYDLFRIATGKFHAINMHHTENLNLTGLVQAEMGFADYYLDFKHNIRKDIQLDPDMPDISGVTSFYSMALWALIRLSARTVHASENKIFSIVTAHDDQCVSVGIKHIEARLSSGHPEALSFTSGVDGQRSAGEFDEQQTLSCALTLLRQGSPEVEIMYEQDTGTLTFRVPYRSRKEGG